MKHLYIIKKIKPLICNLLSKYFFKCWYLQLSSQTFFVMLSMMQFVYEIKMLGNKNVIVLNVFQMDNEENISFLHNSLKTRMWGKVIYVTMIEKA